MNFVENYNERQNITYKCIKERANVEIFSRSLLWGKGTG